MQALDQRRLTALQTYMVLAGEFIQKEGKTRRMGKEAAPSGATTADISEGTGTTML